MYRLQARTQQKKAERSSRISRWKGSMNALYRRISPVGNPGVSIVPLLDQWVEEGRPVDKEQLQVFIKELRSYRRFRHALEVSVSFLRHFKKNYFINFNVALFIILFKEIRKKNHFMIKIILM
ncbi:hypothetical protein Patl1_32861 [Pistacia atlantica]|uniref:Uncharacterized protein n=1 Tax=Pistacia atlantica TaxID=434234 RepID=A0ACC1AM16_9ROSI|nr:hypothetical protein Patl1_32861 [Pistacia atlantica]